MWKRVVDWFVHEMGFGRMERDRIISLDGFRNERMYSTLLDRLSSFCMRLDEEELDLAMEWFAADEPPEGFSPEHQAAFMDWFAFDYRISDGGTTPLSVFAEDRPPEERAMLQAWATAPYSVFHVLQIEGKHVLAQDVLRADQAPLRLLITEQEVAEGDLLLGRLLPVGEVYRPAFHLSWLPAYLLEPFRQVVTTELTRLRRSQPSASIDDLFRERWPLLRDLLAVVGLAMEDGDQLIPPPVLGPQVAGDGQIAVRLEPRGYVVSMAPAQSAGYERVANLLLDGLFQSGVPLAECEWALRLWYDAAAALSPRIQQPNGWAATIAYLWYNHVMDLKVPQADIAVDFGTTASTLGKRSQQIQATLDVQQLDERYTPPLHLPARMNVVGQYLAVGADADTPPLPLLMQPVAPEILAAANSLTEQAVECLKQDDLAGARKLCTDALANCPIFVPALYNMALSYSREKKYDVVVRVADQALGIDHASLLARLLLVEAHHFLGNANQAERYMQDALYLYRYYREHYPLFVEAHPIFWHQLFGNIADLKLDDVLLALLEEEPNRRLSEPEVRWGLRLAEQRQNAQLAAVIGRRS